MTLGWKQHQWQIMNETGSQYLCNVNYGNDINIYIGLILK